jgi:hypothetical protein
MAEGQSQFLLVAEGLQLHLIFFKFLFCAKRPSNAVLTCVLGGAVVAEGKNRDAQISQVENSVIRHLLLKQSELIEMCNCTCVVKIVNQNRYLHS